MRSTSISQTLIDIIFIYHLRKLQETFLCDITSTVKFSYRNFKNFEEKSFSEELKSIDWSLATENNDLDLKQKR